jgi:hypothetical protein
VAVKAKGEDDASEAGLAEEEDALYNKEID